MQEEVPGVELFSEVERVQQVPIQGGHRWTRPRKGEVPSYPRVEGAEVLNFQGVENSWRDRGVVLHTDCKEEIREIEEFPLQVSCHV